MNNNITYNTICKTHPLAPHSFNRESSHVEDRYVCECENFVVPEHYVEISHQVWFVRESYDIIYLLDDNTHNKFYINREYLEEILNEAKTT